MRQQENQLQENESIADIRPPKPSPAKLLSKKYASLANENQKPKLPAGMRRIKIQPHFIERVHKDTVVPVIMLKGEWLRKMGFECEGHVIIVEEMGRLVGRLVGRLENNS